MNGKNKRAGIARVPFAEARRRVLEYMGQHPERLYGTAQLAGAVWPGHTMRAQGAAFAIGPTLHKLQLERAIKWEVHHVCSSKFWGWCLR